MEDRIDSVWNKDERQEIVDNYLAETGRNMFKVDEFTDWLRASPNIGVMIGFLVRVMKRPRDNIAWAWRVN